jgi:CheY-like chemotaxis protein
MHPEEHKLVLVVEDDPDQRRIFKALLYYNGYDVDEAATLSDAMHHIEEHEPDAILMDVVLPDANGLSAASMMKTLPATSHIPVICMTAFDVDQHDVKTAGCADFLRKPFDGSVLIPAVRRLIDG